MSKRIVFCADGTWDNSGKNTNVYRIYKAMATAADQVPYYDDGVGADGTPVDQLAGGAFGASIFQKIKDGYSKIAQVYSAGDAVFLFGFSRGAYTARSLAGMIAVCGLPTKDFSDAVVETAFTAYRDEENRAVLLDQLNANCEMSDAKLKMVGVWDTVGALGIPAVIGKVDPIAFGFLDTSLHPDVLNAYHAIAIDERRAQFPATMWTGPFADGQTVEQVYFAGVHCDVGGSYPDDPSGTALSDITFAWMMSKAVALGLAFDPGVLAAYALPVNPVWSLDTKHESWNVIWGIPKNRSVASDAWIADSVRIRISNENSYDPCNLRIADHLLGPGYHVVDVVGDAPEEAAQMAMTASAR